VFTKDYQDKQKGSVIEYDKEMYHGYIHPLLMKGILNDTEKKVTKRKKEFVDYDLNNDGKFDEKDASIAAKVMAKRKYTKKK